MFQSPANKTTTESTAPIKPITTTVPTPTPTTATTSATSINAAATTSSNLQPGLNVEGFAMMEPGSVSITGTSYDPARHDIDDDNNVLRNANDGQSAMSNSVTVTHSVAASISGSQRYRHAPTQDNPLTFEKLITKSTLSNPDSVVQQQGIIAAFNRDVQGNPLKEENFVTVSLIRGVRIKPGTFKIFHTNNVPFLVGPSDKLIARSNVVTFAKTNEEMGDYSQNERYFSVHGVHVINVPPGQIAKTTDGKKRELLGEGVHVIHSQTLQALTDADFIKISQPYIQHGNLHILRIPIGKIAKVSMGNSPDLLDGQPEPYIFDDATFTLTKKSDKEFYYDSTEKLIVHGTIKRLLPHNGEVAVTYKGSQLEIVKPVADGKPTIITDANHSVPENTFLQVNLNAVTYPAGNTYGYATSRDNVAVKMKLNINYSIVNPVLAVSELAQEGVSAHDAILKHVEACAMTDMTQVIQNSNFYEAQETNHAHTSSSSTSTEMEPAPEYFANMQDKIRHKLEEELLKKGIKLTRLQFSEFSCADEKVKNSAADTAQRTQKIYADVAMLQQSGILNRETAIQAANVKRIEKEAELERARIDAQQQLVTTEGKANQDATVLRIKQTQANDNVLSLARTELEAAKIRAEALMVTAKAEAEAIRLKGIAEAETQKLLAAILHENPEMLQLMIAKEQAKALAGIQGMVVSPETARSVYAVGTPRFFSPVNPKNRG